MTGWINLLHSVLWVVSFQVRHTQFINLDSLVFIYGIFLWFNNRLGWVVAACVYLNFGLINSFYYYYHTEIIYQLWEYPEARIIWGRFMEKKGLLLFHSIESTWAQSNWAPLHARRVSWSTSLKVDKEGCSPSSTNGINDTGWTFPSNILDMEGTLEILEDSGLAKYSVQFLCILQTLVFQSKNTPSF